VSHRFVKYKFIVWYNFIICVSFNTNSCVPACARVTGLHILCSVPVLQRGGHWVSLSVKKFNKAVNVLVLTYNVTSRRGRALCCCVEAVSVIYSLLKIAEVMSESIWLLPVLYPIVS
jgi:hypothetical protein